MDKERATGLLLSAKVFELGWEVDCDDEGFYGQFAIVQSATNAEKEEEDFSYRCVAGELIGPTLPEAQLMAAAPELARWGIELAAEVDEGLNERAHLQIELAEARGEVERLRAELATALALLTRYGGIDGAHHKDWAIDQAIRVMCGVPCGEHGFPGEATNEEYLRHVYEACQGEDGTPGEYEWSYGVAP